MARFFKQQRLSGLAALFAVVAAGLFVGGCASTPPSPTRQVRVAVLDGMTQYQVAPGGETLDKGWWFSARDSYLSPNIGILLGEAMAAELTELPGVEVYSREDLAIYMAQKERLLKRDYPNLSSLQRKVLLVRQDPLDFGRSLNVDYVVSSEILEASTVTNRTLPWWYSHLDATISVWDVSGSELVQKWAWEDTDSFDSQIALVEECARELSRKARKQDVFRVLPP